MALRVILSVPLLSFCLGAPAPAEEPLFPFVVSYDTPENVTNVSAWIERPAGQHGFVRVKDGRLATDAGPIRFWATNLCFEACFPSHEQAERLAARLARLGINCVRMHHMDSHSIWGDSPNKLTIDPKKVERLDYLIHQLKLHGIYTNINLHVSRWFGDREGFVAQQGRPNYDKGLDNFEPRMIELQKKYARDLLAHVNPYTKNAYTHEPAVAFVEISNEDALFAVWGWGELDNLPEPYATTFRTLWNAWLKKKYGSTEELRRAWKVGEWPLGDEMLRNGDFAQPLGEPWSLERDAQTQVDATVQPEGPEGRRCLRIEVRRLGEVSWHPQLSQGRFAVKREAPYTLSFRVRCDKERQININCMNAHEPWERIGLSQNVAAGPQWTESRRTFVATADDSNARITFTNLTPATYELADVSLRPGGIVGLAKDQGLEDGSVPVLKQGEMNLTEPARRDFVDFLWDTERDYWRGTHRFLKDELQVQPLVAGTQLNYSPVHVQAALDYIDAHSYWMHPSFPGRPWDPRNWYVENAALVNQPGGTLAGLAVRRVAGMAYTVSEYNHPAPIAYAAEGFPMIAAFGAFQGWDGIYSFAYCHNAEFEPRVSNSFFDIKADAPKLVHMPACAALFLRGDVAPARQTISVPLSPKAERQKLHETLSAWRLTAGDFGLDPRTSLQHAVAVELKTDQAARPLPAIGDPKVFVSDTGQLRWDLSQPEAGFFIADTQRTKLLTGFVRGRTFDLGGVELKIGTTRLDWATVSMVCIDGAGFDRPGRILVAATGWSQNTGAKVEHLEGDRITLRDRWGTEPVLCEGVPAQVVLPVSPSRVTLYPLDEAGNRRAATPCGDQSGKAVLRLAPQFRTVWYEAAVQ